MKLTSHKIYSKKSTLQKVHDGWENMDEICTSSKKWTLRQLEVNFVYQYLVGKKLYSDKTLEIPHIY